MNNDVIKVQLSCGVDYYKGEKGDKPVKGVDYFTADDINNIVARIEGGEGVDLSEYAKKEYVDNAIANIPAGGITVETDPTVPQWAKQPNKPSYTANEVGALPADTQLFSGNYNDLTNKPTIPVVPSNVSAFNNDAGYVNSSAVNTAISNAEIDWNNVIVRTESEEIDGELVERNISLAEIGVADQATIDAVYSYIDDELAQIDPSLGNADVNADRVLISEEYDDETEETIQTYLPEKLTEIENAIANIPAGGITVETDPTVPSWAKQANKPTYTAQEVGALPANTALFSGNYNDLTNKPTLPPAPIVIQATIAGQPSIVNGNYRLPLTITSNNLPEAYAQYQTHPSTVGISVDLTAMGTPTKIYVDCESFYRDDDGNGGYNYETYGEFNDSSLARQFGYEFMNGTITLSTSRGYFGTLIGVATVNQLGSKANSADLATVATSGDYNDLTNKPTIPTAYTLPTATTSTLGGVKVDGTTITITDGVISATSSGSSSYTLPTASTSTLGGVKVDGSSIVINDGVISASGFFSSVVAEQRDANDNIVAGVGFQPQGIIMMNQYEGVGVNGTLTVDSNGDLCWNNTPIGSGSGSGSGSSYTAGYGISIDNSVIKTLPAPAGLDSVNTIAYRYYDYPDKNSMIEKLRAGKVIYTGGNMVETPGTHGNVLNITAPELFGNSNATTMKVVKTGGTNGTVEIFTAFDYDFSSLKYYYLVPATNISTSGYYNGGTLYECGGNFSTLQYYSTMNASYSAPYASGQILLGKTPAYLDNIKQDKLTFNSTYDATTNPVATMADVGNVDGLLNFSHYIYQIVPSFESMFSYRECERSGGASAQANRATTATELANQLNEYGISVIDGESFSSKLSASAITNKIGKNYTYYLQNNNIANIQFPNSNFSRVTYLDTNVDLALGSSNRCFVVYGNEVLDFIDINEARKYVGTAIVDGLYCHHGTATLHYLTNDTLKQNLLKLDGTIYNVSQSIPTDASGISYTYDPEDNPETAQEMTVKDALDNAMSSVMNGFEVSEWDENQEYEQNTSYYGATIQLQHIDEIDPETGDALGIREMNISASGIEFSSENGGHTRTLGINDYGDLSIDDDRILTETDMVIPPAPSTDGNYVLKVVVSNGEPTYSWVAET